jgi:hypothetical protein
VRLVFGPDRDLARDRSRYETEGLFVVDSPR